VTVKEREWILAGILKSSDGGHFLFLLLIRALRSSPCPVPGKAGLECHRLQCCGDSPAGLKQRRGHCQELEGERRGRLEHLFPASLTPIAVSHLLSSPKATALVDRFSPLLSSPSSDNLLPSLITLGTITAPCCCWNYCCSLNPAFTSGSVPFLISTQLSSINPSSPSCQIMETETHVGMAPEKKLSNGILRLC
jgi:hypothetical protein